MKIIQFAVIAITAASLAGCAGASKFVKALDLKNDPAEVTIDVVSYGTTIHLHRNMPTNWVPVVKPTK